MSLLHSLLDSPLIERLGWTLLHSLWQMTAAGLLLAVALAALRNRAAQARYACACAIMLLVAGVPLVTFLMIETPATGHAVHPRGGQSHAVSDPRSRQAASPEITEAPHRSIMMERPRENEQLVNAAAPKSSTWTSLVPADRLTRALPWLVLTWIVGVLAMSIWNFGGWLAVQQLRRLSIKPAGPAAEELLRKLASRLHLHRPIRLMRSALAQTPLVIGVLKPIILVPASLLSDLPPSELESILAHELAHILRQDYLINLLQSVIETLLFYHPAVWWISRQIRIERENCCDDLALTITGDRATYVRALATVASVRAPMLAPAASGGNLLARLRRIVGTPDAAAPRSSRWIAGMVVTLVLLGAALPRLIPTARAGGQQKMPAAPTVDGDLVRVSGRVIDPGGKPLAGARVVTSPDWMAGYDQKLRPAIQTVTHSGPDGRFEISFSKSQASPFSMGHGQPGQGQWQNMKVAASAPGFGLAWNRWDQVDRAGDIVLQLVADLPMEGRIVDLEGRPVSGVRVIPTGVGSHDSSISSNPLVLCGVNDPLLTDNDGRFRIAGLGRDRQVMLEFQSNKVVLLPVVATTREGPPQVVAVGSDKASRFTLYGNTMELTAAPAISVIGVVRDAQTRQPLAGVSVRTTYSRFDSRAMTDAQGRYRLDGLARGTMIEITAAAPDQPFIPSILQVPNQQGFGPVTLDFDLHKGIWITGKVTDLGTGVPVPAEIDYFALVSNKAAQTIPLLSEGRSQAPVNCDTQPDGTYRLVGLPGRAVLAVRTRDPRYRLGTGFDQIKERNRLGRVNTLFPFVTEDNWNAAKEIDVADKPPTADFQLDSGGTIHVACVDPQGKPIAVSARGERAMRTSPESGESPDGEFDIVGLSRGGEKRLLFVVNRARKLGKIAFVTLDEAQVGKIAIQLEPVAIVTGRLINPDGDPVKGGNIQVETRADEITGANRAGVLVEHSEADRRFRLYLPAGCNYVIRASHSPYGGDFEPINQNLHVTAGATIDLGDFRVSATMR